MGRNRNFSINHGLHIRMSLEARLHTIGLDWTDYMSYPLENALPSFNYKRSMGLGTLPNIPIFSVDSLSTNYRLTIGGYSGNAGDGMFYNNGKQFSTYDMDNDECRSMSCATYYGYGFWFGFIPSSDQCGFTHLMTFKANTYFRFYTLATGPWFLLKAVELRLFC